MAQPIRKGVVSSVKKTKTRKPSSGNTKKRRRRHPKYGTSKLEEKFAREFLDKLGANYVYQFEAEGIGRFFDFYLPDENVIIEVDGDYWHSYGVLDENMNSRQRRSKRADEKKERWAYINGIKVLRFWEHDINKHPSEVLERLKEELHCASVKRNKEKLKKSRH